ncbi:MAG: hypothetical protein II163_01150 [Ruminococcus sp.]|nr:hypothetical protein [Ruminococcus sp.]MBQ1897755.1 hypothetical protein [Ruminococcus sp.]MBQ4238165.1 hypothetical protein [Ruminococcus sp.]
MSDIKRNEIVYEEGWRETAPVVNETVPIDEAQPDPVIEQTEREDGKPLLITIQLVLCLLAALVLFLLKAMDSEGYYSFIDYYHEELQKPVVSEEVFLKADIGKLIAENPVEVQATPDEDAHRED